MRSTNYFIRKRRMIQAAFIALILALVVVSGMAITRSGSETEPDMEFPMANAAICWQQTFHAGSWGE